jgi:hypothetical protein
VIGGPCPTTSTQREPHLWLISTKQTTCEQSNGGNMDSKYNFSSEMKDEDEDQDLIAYIKVI